MKSTLIRILVFCSFFVRADWITFPVNLTIPDNDELGLVQTQTISGLPPILQSLEVRLRITGDPAAWNGDFYATLGTGQGGFAVLLNRVGRTGDAFFGYSDNGFDITFTAAAPDIHLYQDHSPSFDAQGRLLGAWSPDGRNVDPDFVLDTSPRTAGLESFTGINPNANWTLFIADLAEGGQGILESWSLDIVAIPEPGAVWLCLILLATAFGMRRRFF